MSMLAREIAAYLESRGCGVFLTATPEDRTIFVGEWPADVVDGLLLLDVPSPPPHQYIDTEYPVIDFWARSPYTDLAYAKLEAVFEILHRNYAYQTGNWLIHFSRALGNISDVDRDIEGGKLLRLSVQFICRNLNHVS